jgi:gas vesicle protein
MKAVFVVLAVVFCLNSVLAADFFFFPDEGDLYTNQTFDISVKIKTVGDETLNAAQAKINFNKDKLEVVSTNKENSVFNFWLQDPTYSNENGTIEFIGGIAGGLSGASLQVIKISFKTKAEEGFADLNFIKDESAIAANDGLGTNILNLVFGATFKITIPPPPTPEKPVPPPPPPPPEVQVPPPVIIERPIIPAVKLPEAPEVQITLYPEEEKWYNKAAPFLAQWKLPEEIIDVNTAVTRSPVLASALKAPKKGGGLFENKIFPPVSDGLNYLHVQFKSTKGWGEVASYKLAIDTMPPLTFDVTVKEGATTDNPQPTFEFISGDHISGLDYYKITIPGKDPIITNKTSYQLPLLGPGKYRVSVRAHDKAGNSSEAIAELNILPIAPPEIIFFSKDVFIGMESLAVKGKSLPNIKVLLYVKKLTGETIFSSVSSANEEGFWEAVLTPSLKKDTYYVEVVAQDQRGALSLPVKSTFIKVREKPVFAIGAFEITAKMLLGGTIGVLILGFLAGFLFFWAQAKAQRKRISNKIVIAERDVAAAFGVINQDLEKCLKAFEDKKVSKNEAAELELYLKRIEEKIKKAQKYISEGIEEIND